MSSSYKHVQANLTALNERISAAASRYGRNRSQIALVAVSKTFDAAAVTAAARAGQHDFGESYVQEGVAKLAAVRDAQPAAALRWHFIGPIQSNKTRAIAEHFDWVQSVDRARIAQRLSEQRPPALPALNLLLQVNISGETTKSGAAPDQVADLAREIAGLRSVRLRGLMAIPQPVDDFAEQRAAFARMRRLFETIQQLLRHDATAAAADDFDTLSMGMSDDFEAAIAEGSTMIRIGTAIFGARPLAAAHLAQ